MAGEILSRIVSTLWAAGKEAARMRPPSWSNIDRIYQNQRPLKICFIVAVSAAVQWFGVGVVGPAQVAYPEGTTAVQVGYSGYRPDVVKPARPFPGQEFAIARFCSLAPRAAPLWVRALGRYVQSWAGMRMSDWSGWFRRCSDVCGKPRAIVDKYRRYNP
jgi:hypothetical protein